MPYILTQECKSVKFLGHALGFCKHRGGQVSITGIGKQCHDGLAGIFGTLCDLCCGIQCRTGGNSYQDTFLMSDEAAGGKCLIGSNGKDLIINAGIQNVEN